MRHLVSAFVLAALVAGSAACSSNSNGGMLVSEAATTPSPSPVPSPSGSAEPPCATYVLGPPQLVSPMPGATGVLTTIGHIVVDDGPVDGTFQLQAGSGTPFTIGPVTTVSPAPGASPANSMTDVAVPVLASATTYTVTYIADNPQPDCPHETNATLGSFATQ